MLPIYAQIADRSFSATRLPLQLTFMQLIREPLETVLEAKELAVDTLLLRPTNAETLCCEPLLVELAVANAEGATTADIVAAAIVNRAMYWR